MMKWILLGVVLGIAAATDPIWLDDKPEVGYIDVGRGELFYWLFEARNNKETAPVIMWLTGGPGCSSSVALFYENGPFTINKDLTLKKNPYSWNEQAYMLFMDQPVGTGFSTARNYVVNEYQISEDIHKFLKKFFEKHPGLKSRPFFIAGESYAGHYVPAIGSYLAKNSDINLKGLAIGNGLVSPFHQYPEYSNFAYERGKLNFVMYGLTKAAFYVCQALIWTNLWPLAMVECQVNMMFIMGPSFYPFFNPYDITKKCDHPPLCYDFSRVESFLNRKEVKEYVKPKKGYEDCSMIVHYFLLADWWFDFAKDVTYVMDEKKIPVMVYSGDLDFICNWRGGEAWVHKFDWSGKQAFNQQQYKDWKIREAVKAKFKAHGLLSFIRIIDAGHMTPMDQPEYNLAMINEFMFRGIK